MSTPGATELLIVLVIVLVLLGPKRLPSLGRQLGGGIREFRRSLGGSDASARREPAGTRVETAAEPSVPASDPSPAAPAPDAERRSV